MTDGTNPPTNPQPEQPAPGSGGYGFPPGAPASGGYGFPPGPPASGGFGPPPGSDQDGGYGYPRQPGPQQPNPYWQDPGMPGPYDAPPASWQQGGSMPGPTAEPEPFRQRSDQPDWDALADRSASERRRKRVWVVVGTVTVLALLAGGGTFLLLGGGDGKGDDKPTAAASDSPAPSQSGVKNPIDLTPTVAGDPTTVRDQIGKANLKMGPEAGVFPIDKRHEMRTKGNANSFAESQQRVVDPSKSFTVSARLWNRSPKGQQIAVSQGNEKSFSFELGLDEVNGKPSWIFRVQTGTPGANAGTTTVTGTSSKMEKTFSELTGTYDAEKKVIALYVNGKRTGEAPVPADIFPAPGPLQLARSRHQDQWVSPWQGAMDSLRVYDAALPQERIDALKPGKLDPMVTPTGSWLLF
ncbi:LamG-like jellyroll fold domain-containing protein [Streptomyces sp. NPDC060010]|uniref:LamG-like jellyroll fold domain-containing protein n=1 Tax=Streptomyces sp. NPDC060010 TaxID=3347036 RepID=UPI0036C2EE28